MNPIDELTKLTSLFPEDEAIFQDVEYIASSTTPEPYRGLLVHEHHMTVSMEQFHGDEVEVKVHEVADVEGSYARKITLLCKSTGKVVQFGIVRFDFSYVTDAVKREIIAGEIPLGRVLINHNVLRHIDLGAILKFEAGPALEAFLPIKAGQTTYGRLATIFCNGKPAVDLLEISSPLEPALSDI